MSSDDSSSPFPLSNERTTRQVPDVGRSDLVSTGNYLDLLSKRIVHEVTDQVDQRQRHRFWILAAIFAIFMLLGFIYATLTTRQIITRSVTQQLNAGDVIMQDSVEHQLADATATFNTLFDEFRADFEFEAAYQEFTTLSQSFVNDDIGALGAIVGTTHERLMAVLEQLAQSPDRLSRKDTFPTLLATVVDAVTSAERMADVDQLDALFRAVLTTHPRSTRMMVDYYGIAVMGSLLPLTSQPEERLAKLQIYAEAAHEQGQRHLFVAWNLLLEFQRNDFQANAATDNLVESIDYLDEDETRNLYAHLAIFADPSLYQYSLTPEGVALGRKVQQLLDEYPQLKPGTDEQSLVIGRLGAVSRLSELRATRSERDAGFFLALALDLDTDAENWTQLETIEGTLGDGNSELRPIQSATVEGREYRFAGACDQRCRDVDLTILIGDTVLDEDTGVSDVPDVSYVAVGELPSLLVEMDSCSALSCGYAIAVLERQEPQ